MKKIDCCIVQCLILCFNERRRFRQSNYHMFHSNISIFEFCFNDVAFEINQIYIYCSKRFRHIHCSRVSKRKFYTKKNNITNVLKMCRKKNKKNIDCLNKYII